MNVFTKGYNWNLLRSFEESRMPVLSRIKLEFGNIYLVFEERGKPEYPFYERHIAVEVLLCRVLHLYAFIANHFVLLSLQVNNYKTLACYHTPL